MKIDRRGFLSFVVGGAAGTALSPLPWKMMDDFSIWSQVWPWVPVPKDGESFYANTVCSLCSGGCGITVRSIDNKAIKIEGSKGHPVNNGKICGFGLSGLQLLYGPTRVKSPMKKIGGRDSGRWQRISWREATFIVSEKLKFLRVNGKGRKVAFVSKDNGGTVSSLMRRFCMAYGTPHFFNSLSENDVASSALKAFTGTTAAVSFDFENSDFVLNLGSGLLDGWSSPVRTIMASSKWYDSGAEIVQLESFLSNTAAMATRWVPINPGTEADLIFGISALIVRKNLCNIESILQKISNFSRCIDILARDYSLESVSSVTGVDVNTIINLAESFVGASRPLALCSGRSGSVLSGFRDYVSVYLLNLIAGRVNKDGGLWICKDHNCIDWPALCMDRVARDGLKFEDVSSKNIITPSVSIDDFVCNLNSGSVDFEALFVSDVNLCHSLSGAASIRESLQRIPFLVSFSSFMDETTAIADLILPDHVYLEKLEDIPVLTGSGRPVIGFSRPVIPAQFNTKHVGDTIIDIACSIGGNVAESFPWVNYRECLKQTFEGKGFFSANTNFWIGDELERIELTQLNYENTATLFSAKLEGDASAFPLVLIPRDSLRLPSGSVAAPPFLVKILDDTTLSGEYIFIDINPVTAEKLGLNDGENAILTTSEGQVEVRVHFSNGMRPGVVSMLRGLGHGAHDGYIAGKGVNVNDLIGFVKDPVLGHDVAWGIRSRLAKV